MDLATLAPDASSACEMSNKAEKDMKLFAEMQQSEAMELATLAPDDISACEKSHNGEKDIGLHGEMQQVDLSPEVSTYNALTWACEKSSKAEKDIELFAEMQASTPMAQSIRQPRQGKGKGKPRPECLRPAWKDIACKPGYVSIASVQNATAVLTACVPPAPPSGAAASRSSSAGCDDEAVASAWCLRVGIDDPAFQSWIIANNQAIKSSLPEFDQAILRRKHKRLVSLD